MDIISDLGPNAVARLVGCKAPSVVEWRKRGIPAERCVQIERATEGQYTCEQINPRVRWVRVPDAAWPWHPQGRPLQDHSAPAMEAQRAAA
jgi:DNA-binding transcriptional regulator YdaS (Cro superfamily)